MLLNCGVTRVMRSQTLPQGDALELPQEQALFPLPLIADEVRQ